VVVLVGDFCLARALETVALTGSLAMVQTLATTVTEMAEGEVAQLERAGTPTPPSRTTSASSIARPRR
jgi:geranylgeranyl pyrophosphate synthase